MVKAPRKNENGWSCGKLAVPDVVMVVDPFVDVFPVSNRHLRLLKLRKMFKKAINVTLLSSGNRILCPDNLFYYFQWPTLLATSTQTKYKPMANSSDSKYKNKYRPK